MPHNYPLLSIITTAYNAEKTLAETIQSVIAQDYPSKEYVIVNDGSTDKTADIAASFEHQHPWIRVINTSNKGIAAARNTAWKATQGSLVCILDADDLYRSKALQNLYKSWLAGQNAQTKIGLVYGAFQRTYDDGQGENIFVSPPQAAHRGAPLLRQLFMLNLVLPSASMMARHALETVGGWREHTDGSAYDGQDFDLVLRLAEQFDFIKCEDAITDYRQHEAQRTSNISRIRYDKDQVCIDFITKHGVHHLFPEAQTPEKLASRLERLSLNLVQHTKYKPIDTALLMLKIAHLLHPTPQRERNIQIFSKDIPTLMNTLYPDGKRCGHNINPIILAQTCQQKLQDMGKTQ